MCLLTVMKSDLTDPINDQGGISLKRIHIPLKYILRFLLACLVLISLTGCGKDAKIETYKANMNQFFENIRIFDSSINAIDPNSETATTELLSLLDSMNTSFSQMASLEVPDSFPGVADLATQASEYMSEAVIFYHQAYDGEYDATLEDVARQNYERANLRLQYIVSILHGDIPEEIYTYEDDETEGTSEDEFAEDEFSEN